MSTQISYAYRRHNTWIYRRTYPQHLQGILGSSLKRSLHTADAKVALKRVSELNATFEAIVQEAEAQLANSVQSSAPAQIAVAVPRYPRARLLGEQQVQEVAAVYLAEASNRLRPGSYKSVRFALAADAAVLGLVRSKWQPRDQPVGRTSGEGKARGPIPQGSD